MILGQRQPAGFEDVRVRLYRLAELIQLRERFRGIAQFQPANGGSQILQVRVMQFHREERSGLARSSTSPLGVHPRNPNRDSVIVIIRASPTKADYDYELRLRLRKENESRSNNCLVENSAGLRLPTSS